MHHHLLRVNEALYPLFRTFGYIVIPCDQFACYLPPVPNHGIILAHSDGRAGHIYMTEKQEPKPYQQQVYDSTLKSLLQDQPGELLSLFIDNVEVLQSLDGEAIKPTTLRTDRCFLIKKTSKRKVLHLELETGADSDILPRMLEYYGILYRKYKLPIIAVVIYPFFTTLPESQLCIMDEDEKILIFNVHVIGLWNYKAKTYLDQHKVSIYSLLPTMGGANYAILNQALEEMKESYREQPTRFANHLLWFGVFLRRTTMVSPLDKERILTKMTDFESLLNENPFVEKVKLEAEEKGIGIGREEGREEGRTEGLQEGIGIGREEGREEGRTEGLQEAVVGLIETRFPPLTELAHRKVSKISKPELLNVLLKQVAVARDEDMARIMLDSFAA